MDTGIIHKALIQRVFAKHLGALHIEWVFVKILGTLHIQEGFHEAPIQRELHKVVGIYTFGGAFLKSLSKGLHKAHKQGPSVRGSV